MPGISTYLVAFVLTEQHPIRPLALSIVLDAVMSPSELTICPCHAVIPLGADPTTAGTLGEDATVTVSEMKEHVFYQLLNLAQALSHCLCRSLCSFNLCLISVLPQLTLLTAGDLRACARVVHRPVDTSTAAAFGVRLVAGARSVSCELVLHKLRRQRALDIPRVASIY